MRHTKGPWETHGKRIHPAGRYETQIAAINPVAGTRLGDFDWSQTDANAALIAAAPEMYELLQKAVPVLEAALEPVETTDDAGHVLNALYALLARLEER